MGIVQDVQEYMHRGDLTETLALQFIEATTTRLQTALKTLVNQQAAQVVMTAAGPVDLPADYASMRSVSHVVGGQRCELFPIGYSGASQLPTTGSQPIGYYIENDDGASPPQIGIAPDKAVTLDLVYWAQVSTITDSSGIAPNGTNNVLLRFPSLYLYGALWEAHVWAQDFESAAAMKVQFEQELERINRAASRETFGPGIGRAARGLQSDSSPVRSM